MQKCSHVSYYLVLNNFSAPIPQEICSKYVIFTVMKKKKLCSWNPIKKDPIKQIDKTEEKRGNYVSCNVQSEGDGMLCTSRKVYRWEWTKSLHCIFLPEVRGVWMHIWSLWREKSTSTLSKHWQNFLQCIPVIDA